jgi:AraC family transcriptional regulator
VHVYLSQDGLAATCRQMYERDVADVELLDEVKADDPAIHSAAMAIAAEAAQGGAGSRLLVDSLSCQLAVHILRRHAHVQFREPDDSDGLTFRQERTVRDYVEAHLGENISLDDLAAAVALSRFHFARMFRQSVGVSGGLPASSAPPARVNRTGGPTEPAGQPNRRVNRTGGRWGNAGRRPQRCWPR